MKIPISWLWTFTSSMKTLIHLLMFESNISFIVRENVPMAFFKPKGITFHSNNPILAIMTIFQTSFKGLSEYSKILYIDIKTSICFLNFSSFQKQKAIWCGPIRKKFLCVDQILTNETTSQFWFVIGKHILVPPQ
jgi:hypothetical protein